MEEEQGEEYFFTGVPFPIFFTALVNQFNLASFGDGMRAFICLGINRHPHLTVV